jgi:hypothetical protein
MQYTTTPLQRVINWDYIEVATDYVDSDLGRVLSSLLFRPHHLPLLPTIHIDHLAVDMTTEVVTRKRDNRHSNGLDRNRLT